MKRRTLAIVGNALLFTAVAACDDDVGPVETSETGVAVDGAISPDATADDASAADMTLPDMDGLDVGQADGAPALDLGLGDMAPDQSVPEDMALADLGADQSVPVDMALEADMAAPVDMTLEADMAVPVDMAPPVACQDSLGEACPRENDACCDSMGSAETVCQGGVWRVPDLSCFCEPRGDGTIEAICAVPGFVGVAEAEWQPRAAVRLRGLAA